MKPIEAFSALFGQFCAAINGYFIGAEYGAAIGWAVFLALATLVDIRTRIKPYWTN